MKKITRITALLLIAVMALSLCSCDKPVTVLEYDGTTIPTNMYSYILTEYKSYLLSSYEIEDSAELWSTPATEGGTETVGDQMEVQIINYCKSLLSCMSLAKSKNVTLSDTSLEALEKLKTECTKLYGGEGKWNVYLSTFGTNVKTFEEYMKMSYMLTDTYNALVEDGTLSVTDEACYDFFADYYKDYKLVRHILFNVNFQTTDESGEKVNLTDEQKTARKAELTALAEQMANGEVKFEDYLDKNEDSGVYYFVTNDNSYVKEFTDAALDMEIGEYRLVQTEFGYHLMNRVELTKDLYEEQYAKTMTETIKKNLLQDKFYALLDETADKVTINQEELDKYDIATAPVMS